MTTSRLLNHGWMYCPHDKRAFSRVRSSVNGWTRVTLPHAVAAPLPANTFSEQRWQIVSWYRRRIRTPEGLADRRVFLDFDGVMLSASVYLNGKLAAEHRGGYDAFSVDVTPFLDPKAGADNVVAIRVDSRLQADIPPCGRVMDFQTFGGIYRDVRLRLTPLCHIEDLHVTTPRPLAAVKTVHAVVTVRNTGREDWRGAARLELCDARGRRLATGARVPCAVSAGKTASLTLTRGDLTGLTLWDLDDPQLYVARATLLDGSRIADRMETRVGFRSAIFSKDGPFLLNGKPLKLIGLNRHQTYPYMGAAAPRRLQRRDAEILKRKLGCNVVRTSHYPQSPHFLDRCDEIGLLVFEEIPGWGFIGDDAWKELACRDVEAMIRRDRNHPSVILWGVRVNESGDDHDFYTRTNALARSLDPSRPTGGVRWGVRSEFLEDVFTANDYAYQPPRKLINEPLATPYLITEFGPLTDPRRTASMDVQVRFALGHADILNAIFGHPKIAGGIGWCAFDYHSQDWVTVDGIQPWGVCDVFREPKLTAAVYASQLDPEVHPVLVAATRWKVGDQAGFDPNEQTVKAGGDVPLVVFSNAEQVDVLIDGEKRGCYKPAHDRFPHLPHPPFFCAGLGKLWGPSWKALRLIARVRGVPIAEQCFPATNDAPGLDVAVDDQALNADGADMTRMVIRHVDCHGNVQNFSRVAVRIDIKGPVTLVGPRLCALAGGVAAVYLRAGARPGVAAVTVTAPELNQKKRVCLAMRDRVPD